MTDAGEPVRQYHHFLKHVLDVLPAPTTKQEREAVEYIQREYVYSGLVLEKDKEIDFTKARRHSLQRAKEYYQK
jgi:hypothetical protein